MFDALKNDPALKPFLEFTALDDDDNSSNSKSSNTISPSSKFPPKGPEYYQNNFEELIAPVKDSESFKKGWDHIQAVQGRLYKAVNNKAVINSKNTVVDKDLILILMIFLFLGDSTYNSVVMGGNVNEFTYYNNTNRNIRTIFTHIQKVDYPEGEDGRRERLGKNYRVLVEEVQKFVNEELRDLK